MDSVNHAMSFPEEVPRGEKKKNAGNLGLCYG